MTEELVMKAKAHAHAMAELATGSLDADSTEGMAMKSATWDRIYNAALLDELGL